jgi:hypothetical protein
VWRSATNPWLWALAKLGYPSGITTVKTSSAKFSSTLAVMAMTTDSTRDTSANTTVGLEIVSVLSFYVKQLFLI